MPSGLKTAVQETTRSVSTAHGEAGLPVHDIRIELLAGLQRLAHLDVAALVCVERAQAAEDVALDVPAAALATDRERLLAASQSLLLSRWYTDVMNRTLTADDVLPLIAALSPEERTRLLRLVIARETASAEEIYRRAPPRSEEFSTDENPLAWEAEGWDSIK